MTIIDETVLQSFRDARQCEVCDKVGPVEPHHILAKGMGGGKRLDVPYNLVACCRECHTGIHVGNGPPLDYLLATAAKRELYKLMRMPKP